MRSEVEVERPPLPILCQPATGARMERAYPLLEGLLAALIVSAALGALPAGWVLGALAAERWGR